MAQSKSNAAPQQDIEQLSEQISALKQDVSAVSETLAELGKSTRDAAATNARRKAAHLREVGETQFEAAQHRAGEIGQNATEAVRQQPATFVGLAVGLGFLLGFVSGRK